MPEEQPREVYWRRWLRRTARDTFGTAGGRGGVFLAFLGPLAAFAISRALAHPNSATGEVSAVSWDDVWPYLLGVVVLIAANFVIQLFQVPGRMEGEHLAAAAAPTGTRTHYRQTPKGTITFDTEGFGAEEIAALHPQLGKVVLPAQTAFSSSSDGSLPIVQPDTTAPVRGRSDAFSHVIVTEADGRARCTCGWEGTSAETGNHLAAIGWFDDDDTGADR